MLRSSSPSPSPLCTSHLRALRPYQSDYTCQKALGSGRILPGTPCRSRPATSQRPVASRGIIMEKVCEIAAPLHRMLSCSAAATQHGHTRSPAPASSSRAGRAEGPAAATRTLYLQQTLWLLRLQRQRASILRGAEGVQRDGGAAGDGAWTAQRDPLPRLLFWLTARPMPLALSLPLLCRAAS
jgi:hypothetical protein